MRRGRLLALFFLAALAGAGAWLLFRPEEPAIVRRYPVLADADGSLVDRIEQGWSDFGSIPGMRAKLDAMGPDAPLAFLAVLARRTPAPNPTSGLRYAGPAGCGEWLADRLPTANRRDELEAALLRMADDDGIGWNLREAAIFAIARPGSVAGRDRLASLAADPRVSAELRREALFAIGRTGRPLPESVRERLWLPFHRLDEAAAAALAISGRSEAPSLVLAGLRRLARRPPFPSEDAVAFARAAAATAQGDPAVVTPAGELAVLGRARSLRQDYDDHFRETVRTVADALEGWLARHPEAGDTAFEGARRDYLASDVRKRETAFANFDEMLDAPVGGGDFATAALAACGFDGAARDDALWAVERLSRLLARDIGNETDPEAILAAIRRRLLDDPPPVLEDDPYPESGLPFRLPWVLASRRGSCLGWTTLYLAIADRLHLPLFAVAAPGHAFVRWDDGRTRRNVETTDGGRENPDSFYYEQAPDLVFDPEEAKAAGFLRDLTRRETLGLVCDELAYWYRTTPGIAGGTTKALAAADRAVRLLPKSAMCHVVRGLARAAAGPEFREGALADLSAALELPGAFPLQTALVEDGLAHVLAASGRHEQAIGHHEAARKELPGWREPAAGLVRSLIALGRYEKAIAAADANDLPALRVQAMILSGRRDWGELLGENVDPKTDPAAWMSVVEALLQKTPEHAPEPELATELMGRLAWIDDSTRPSDPDDLVIVRPGRFESVDGGRKRYEELKKRIATMRGR